MNAHTHTDILIVGAGMAGLMAAHNLTQRHINVLLVEKNSRVGGRLATAKIGGGLADTGAQFITVRNPQFKAYVDHWLDHGLVFEWAQGWSDGSLNTAPFDRHPRYAVYGGMVALAEHLAAGLDIWLDTQITLIALNGDGWLAQDDRGHTLTASALLLTPPVPLSLNMLNAGQVVLSSQDRAALEVLTYDPCLVGLFSVDGRVRLPEPGAVQRPTAPISWIADNRRKGLSPDKALITVHASAAYSRRIWSRPDWEALVALESALREFKDRSATVIDAHLERWLYSIPVHPYPNRYLHSISLPSLVFAGDSFGSPRVEGAALSGLAAAKALVGALTG
jgi:renalase